MSNRRTAFRLPEVKYSTTTFGATTIQGVSSPGGFDQTTPTLRLQPGALTAVQNYECNQSGGYGRIDGYERVDGQARPSDATYTIIQLDGFTSAPTVGSVISQGASTATVAAVYNLNGIFYLAVTQVSAAFNYTDPVYLQTNNPYLVTAANPLSVTVASGPFLVPTLAFVGNAILPTVNISSLFDAQYTAAAADIYRALIGAVPGLGDVLGVCAMPINGVDTVFAFRANVGGTEVNIYKTTTSGWSQVPFYDIVSFTSGGTAVVADGETLTQGGVTATVKRVMGQTGTWAASSEAGQFVITAPNGGSFAAGAATLSGGASVTLSGAQSAISLTPGGKYEIVVGNFTGSASTKRFYGCDGENQGFEFDGDVYAPISTGNSPDNPNHVAVHKNYLIFSQGASITGCAPGLPFDWQAIDGAFEIATGDLVTGMTTLPGSQTTATLAVFQLTNTSFLYGTDVTSFNFVSFNTGIGAISGSVQNLFDTFVMDNLGVISLKTTLNYGNFLPSTLTKNIFPFIKQERGNVTCSTINRDKSQYRIFFSDGYGLYLTVVNQNYLGAAVTLFPDAVKCCFAADLTGNRHALYFGSSSGYVFQMDKGTSFDGQAIDAFATFAWDAIRSPLISKRFRSASIEISSDGYAAISFGYQLGYGTTNVGQPDDVDYAVNFVPAPMWDVFTWDSFTWDGSTLQPTYVEMQGSEVNVQVTIRSGTNYMPAYNLNSIVYGYTPERGVRP